MVAVLGAGEVPRTVVTVPLIITVHEYVTHDGGGPAVKEEGGAMALS